MIFEKCHTKTVLMSFLLLSMVYVTRAQSGEEKLATVRFEFICDHAQTTIVADQGIMIYFMSDDFSQLYKATTYCNQKKVDIHYGSYTVIIESSKYCTNVIDDFNVQKGELKLSADLLKEDDPDCSDEQNFVPHPSKFE